MISIFIKTLIVYVILVGVMRILGKRQLGELELSELITTILLSEIASMPITDQDASLIDAFISIATITLLEVGFSILISKFPKIKNTLASSPSVLIYDGVINQAQMIKNRISPEELLSELRLKNITDPAHVKYAIIEPNGMVSVIPKPQYQQPTLEDLKISTDNSGIAHIIISQGTWNEHNIKSLNMKKSDFTEYLKRKRTNVKDIFLLTIDDSGEKRLVKKK